MRSRAELFRPVAAVYDRRKFDFEIAPNLLRMDLSHRLTQMNTGATLTDCSAEAENGTPKHFERKTSTKERLE
jgi:hypothetical protein